MKLELKHLAPYLPFNLYFQRFEHECIDKTKTPVIYSQEKYPIKTQLNEVTLNSFNYNENKPILRPMYELSDYFLELYGSLEHQDVTDYFDEYYLGSFFNLEIHEIASTRPEYLPYGTLQVLFKHHFDVFGLIEKGLAIDIKNL